ncbi:MAG: MFS transporter [Myxococcota bacterium]|nr:MFS transporter [Myxococcota bacterium]
MASIRELLAANRDFRRLFIATAISLAGDWFSFVAVADLVIQLTGRPGSAAFVYAATVLPVFLASPLAGAVADRYDRKRVVVIADLARVPLALLLCVAAWAGSVALAIGAIIAIGVGASVYGPAASAAMPNLVDARDLPRVQSAMAALWGSMLLVGASIGGIFADVLGMQAAFVINALTFAVSAWLLRGIERPLQLQRPVQGARIRVRDAIHYIRGDKVVRRLVLAKIGGSFASGTVGLLPAVAVARISGSSIAIGLLIGARGIGAILGPLFARRITGAVSSTTRTLIAFSGAATMIYCVAYAVLPISQVLAIAVLLVIVASLTGTAQWTLSTYGLMVTTPDHLRGRVMAIDYALATLAIGVSSITAGFLANAYDEATAIWWLVGVGAAYQIVWLVWGLLIPGEPLRER